MDHDRHENDAWVLHPKLRHVPMGLTKGFEALGAGLALLRKQRKPRSVDVYANFHVHAAGRTIAGARQSAADVAERNFKALNRMKTLTRRNATCALRSDGAPCTPEEHYVGELLKARYVISPPGSQIDCHRHWEALVFGAVPVVHSSPITISLLDGCLRASCRRGTRANNGRAERCDDRLAERGASTGTASRSTTGARRSPSRRPPGGASRSLPPKGTPWKRPPGGRRTATRSSKSARRAAGRLFCKTTAASRSWNGPRAQRGEFIVAFARVHGHASRIATITSTLAWPWRRAAPWRSSGRDGRTVGGA